MKTAGRKSANGLKDDCESSSEIDTIVDHVEKNGNCEFVRILEQFSKMDDDGKRKLMNFAQKLAE